MESGKDISPLKTEYKIYPYYRQDVQGYKAPV